MEYVRYPPSTAQNENEIKVSLLNHQYSYKAGQAIIGEVLLTIRKPTRVKGNYQTV